MKISEFPSNRTSLFGAQGSVLGNLTQDFVESCDLGSAAWKKDHSKNDQTTAYVAPKITFVPWHDWSCICDNMIFSAVGMKSF